MFSIQEKYTCERGKEEIVLTNAVTWGKQIHFAFRTNIFSNLAIMTIIFYKYNLQFEGGKLLEKVDGRGRR